MGKLLIRILVQPILLLCLALNTLGQANSGRLEKPRVLITGSVIEREMAGEQVHVYLVTAANNAFLHVTVDQRGVDVVLGLYAPDGTKVKEVDSPNGTQGLESLEMITKKSGKYRVEVRSLEKTGSGKYVVTLSENRAATAEDRERMAKLTASENAQQLSNQAESLSQEGRYDDARQLFERALAIREKALGAEHPDVALSLSDLGRLYFAKGDYAQAQSLFQRALAIDERTFGAAHPNVATDLNNLALMYDKQGDYARAAELYIRALAIREKALGPADPEVATSVGNLAALYYGKGDYARAEPLFRRALAIREKIFGADDPNIAVDLSNLASLYHANGDYMRAELMFQRVLTIRERVLGPEHPDIAAVLNNLAAVYKSRGEYARADPLYQRALAIREKLGAEHPLVAVSLNNLATLYDSMGDYARAEPLYIRAVAILEKALGPDHPAVAASLTNLALVYDNKGDYARSEPLYVRALAIREKKLGPLHPEVATSLNNLAALYYNKGDYVLTEPLFQRALMIHEKALGPQHPDVAADLNNLATMYHSRGDYARAEPLFQRALAIREKALGRDHPAVAITLSNLSALYHLKGDYARAEALLQRALAIREKALGADHPEVGTSVHNLAAVYESMGDYPRAESLYQRALAIREKALGREHPDVATTLNNLGALHKDRGDYQRAEALYLHALAIREKALNAHHPDIAISLGNLAALYYAKGDYARGMTFLERLNDIQEFGLGLILGIGSENQKQLYLNTLSGKAESTVSLHIRLTPHDEHAASLALTAILQRKGRTLDAMTDQIGVLRRRANPQDEILLRQLAAARSQLATLQISGGRRLSPDARKPEIARLANEVERLENEVSERSGEFRAQSQPITLNTVRQALPLNAALVEIFVYRPFDPKAGAEAAKFGAPRYVAYVTRRDQAAPQWVELGEAEWIDSAAARWGQALASLPTVGKNEQLSKSELRRRLAKHQADTQQLARSLDERVMRPIRKLLGETRHIFLSPDGALNLIPFAALVDENGKYLVENYSINYLTSGRDLLRLRVQKENRSAPVLVANPLYDLSATTPPAASSAQVNQGDENVSRRSMDFALKTYTPLPGTAEEAMALARLLPQRTQILLEEQATEELVKQVKGPLVLHIATHGFFLPNLPQGGANRSVVRETFDALSQSSLPGTWENPLLRSGLILAGVKQGKSGQDEDGVLTALEVAGLDLWGTKLVVLSACETGLGDVKNGAGVYGLRRALVLAGSETQVMSLWKVSDTGTRDLMTAYYSRLQTGEGRAEALRQVQLMMLRGQLRPTASSGKRGTIDPGEKVVTKDYRHPYYWAAFIQSGDWRNLEGK